MAGESILLDTNVVVKFLSGKLPPGALQALENKSFHLSFVSEIELRSFNGPDKLHAEQVALFLPTCAIHGISEVIKDHAVMLRKAHRLKTADAVIAATAIVKHMPLMTGEKGLRRTEKEVDLVFIKYP